MFSAPATRALTPSGAAEGKWASITGASSGIGRALVLEFARDGYNVLLTGRNGAALEEAAAECSRSFSIETEIVPADLSRLEDIDRLAARIAAAPRRFAALVNNAGFGIHGDFATTDVEQSIAMLHVQLAAAL
jgi:short-subunit dehydrogenase